MMDPLDERSGAMDAMLQPAVVVLGSINVDLIVEVDRLPQAGETVLGGDALRAPGGKGANQAVGLARLGRDVVLIGRVGDDEAGSWLLAGLAADGVDARLVTRTPRIPSGSAMIMVERIGAAGTEREQAGRSRDNTIVVSPAANAHLGVDDLARPEVAAALAVAPAVLVQLEVPMATVVALAAHLPMTNRASPATGAPSHALLVLDPAPAPDGPLPAELLARVDVLVPNRSELGRLTGRAEPVGDAQVTDAVHALRDSGFAGDVIVTLGSEGALVATRAGAIVPVAAVPVEAVDPTGAGDAFRAALTHHLAAGEDVVTATQVAVLAGALATTRLGAQSALPDAEEMAAAAAAASGAASLERTAPG